MLTASMHIKNIKFEVGDSRQFPLLKEKQDIEQKRRYGSARVNLRLSVKSCIVTSSQKCGSSISASLVTSAIKEAMKSQNFVNRSYLFNYLAYISFIPHIYTSYFET